MKVVSVINYKGGVGKTTLTANLGAYAAMRGLRVLMIDLDPQTHLTFSFMAEEDWQRRYKDSKTLKKYFDSVIYPDRETVPLSSLAVRLSLRGCARIDIIPSSLELTNLDTNLAGSCGTGEMSVIAGSKLRMYNHLRRGLDSLGDEYDLALIDCPPNCNASVRNALVASDYYLVPSRMDYLSCLGVENLERSVRSFREEYADLRVSYPRFDYGGLRVKMLGIVPMMVAFTAGKMLKAHKEQMEKLSSEGYHIFPYLRDNAKTFSASRVEGGPVVLTPERYLSKVYAKSALNKVVQDFYDIGNEFLSYLSDSYRPQNEYAGLVR